MREQWEREWKDYYKILGVDSEAEPEAIEGAFKALVRKYHPDRTGALSAERMKSLNEAAAVLRHPQRRRAYDSEYRIRLAQLEATSREKWSLAEEERSTEAQRNRAQEDARRREGTARREEADRRSRAEEAAEADRRRAEEEHAFLEKEAARRAEEEKRRREQERRQSDALGSKGREGEERRSREEELRRREVQDGLRRGPGTGLLILWQQLTTREKIMYGVWAAIIPLICLAELIAAVFSK